MSKERFQNLKREIIRISSSKGICSLKVLTQRSFTYDENIWMEKFWCEEPVSIHRHTLPSVSTSLLSLSKCLDLFGSQIFSPFIDLLLRCHFYYHPLSFRISPIIPFGGMVGSPSFLSKGLIIVDLGFPSLIIEYRPFTNDTRSVILHEK